MVLSGATIYEKFMDSSSSVPGTGIEKTDYIFIGCSATLARIHLYAEEEKYFFWSGAERFWVAFMAEDPNSRPVITTASSPYLECGNSSTETPWYDKESMLRVPKYLILVEVVSKLYYHGFKTRLELY